MHKIIAVVIAFFVVVGVWTHAQQVQPNNPRIAPNVQPPAQVVSGADFGFRVESYAADGTPQGRIVVRQNGQWVEVGITGGVRRLGLN